MRNTLKTTIKMEVQLDDLVILPQYAELSETFRWGLELLMNDSRYTYISREVEVEVEVTGAVEAVLNALPENCSPYEPAYAEPTITREAGWDLINPFMRDLERQLKALSINNDAVVVYRLLEIALDGVIEYVAENFEELLYGELHEGPPQPILGDG